MPAGPRIAIVGGGISGVATAYELARRDRSEFVLYEASPRLGGIVETVRQDGFVIECGPDSWVAEKPWARELAVELGLEDEIIPSQDHRRRTYLLHGESLVPMPDGMRMMVPADLESIADSPLFSEQARQAYRGEPARAEELKAFALGRQDGEDESIASFVERHFGEEATAKIAAPLLAGVFGGDIRQLSAAAVMAPFVKMEREYGSLILALQANRRRREAAPSVFTTVKSGLQSLIDGMTLAIPPTAIRRNEPVLSVVPNAGSWQVATPAGIAEFDAVVLSTPIHLARKLVAPWHEELQQLLDIEATSSVVAAFAFDEAQSASFRVPEGFGFLVPQSTEPSPLETEPPLLACTFVDQKFPDRAPAGCVLLRAFYGGRSAPEILGQPDEAIAALARRQLARILGELPEPKISLVRRWPHSLPQYTVGHHVRVARIETLVREVDGLSLIGNALRGVGLPDLVRQGRSLAAELSS